jgi:hypothetical protein
MAVHVKECKTFESFLSELHKRRSVRIVKLADYGFVAPVRTNGGAFVMMPQVKLVATAFDKVKATLLRWQETDEARKTVTIHAGVGRGEHNETRILTRRQNIEKRLEVEGFAVSEGEWSPDELEQLIQPLR